MLQKNSQEGPSPKKYKDSIDDGNAEGACFFCDRSDGEDLHLAKSTGLSKRVKECATNVGDVRILNKLKSKELHELGAHYHLKCLSNLCNNSRDLIKAETKESCERSAESLAFDLLLSYIKRKHACGISCFKLKDLVKICHDKLLEHDPDSPMPHRTRLKLKLLKSIPEMQEVERGKETTLVWNNNEQIHAKNDTKDDRSNTKQSKATKGTEVDEEILVQCAKSIRQAVFEKRQKHDCATNRKDCVIPDSLFRLIRMILIGSDSVKEIEGPSNRDTAVQSISELIIYNILKYGEGQPTTSRHCVENETPLPVYNALKIHVKTRSKELIEKQHELGMSISYWRTLEVTDRIRNSVCNTYISQGLVCPPSLPKGVFCTSAIDNLDHDPSSTHANWSFHGTAISITCHPTLDLPPSSSLLADNKVTKNVSLLEDYRMVPEAFLKNKSPTVPDLDMRPHSQYQASYIAELKQEDEWIENLRCKLGKEALESEDQVSWSAYHASKCTDTVRAPAKSSMLPLFFENAHSVKMVKHGMEVVGKATKHLNPCQVYIFFHDTQL